MAAETVTQRGKEAVADLDLITRIEPSEQCSRQYLYRRALIDRSFNGPAAFAAVCDLVRIAVKAWVFGQGICPKVE